MGSLWSWWTLWAGATLLWGLTQEATVDPRTTGEGEFLTAFLQNYQPGYSTASLHLFISSLSENPASVSIFSRTDNTSQKVTVKPGESVVVNITSRAEVTGSNSFQHAVVVHSDRAISVQAVNEKPSTAEVTLVRPVRALGTTYFVFTPPGNSATNAKEFAVVAGAAGASVNIHLKGLVTFQGKNYPPGSVLSVTLQPFAVIQLQSTYDLSGSKVTASSPVAVLTGHSCVQKHTSCDHVVEQLLPTSSWGTQYVVPSLASQARYDLVYVVASQATKLTYNQGAIAGSRGLQSGDVMEFEVRPSHPLYLSADVGIQVLLFGTGAVRNRVTYDPYLVLVPDVAAYCPAYVIKSIPGVENLALVVAPTKAAEGVTLDGQALGTKVTWTAVPGSEFSYTEVDLGTADKTYMAEAATNFSLLTFGLGASVGFGTAAACGQTLVSPAEPSCEGVKCGSGQVCQLVNRKPTCVEESMATCRAQGDPHYTTFDGHRYDMMGTCTYTMVELCSSDVTLPAFIVEVKNEHRGSRRVSYVGLVTVRAYSHDVSLARGEVGFAQIDDQRSLLPVSLSDGRLRVYQSGTQAVVELDFGLVVKYDWDCQLTVSLPTRFQDQVCGLCGNYNGDSRDDFLTPEREQAANAVEFAQSWKLDDGDYLCHDGCENDCPTCTPGQAQHYEGDRLCGMLALPDGPFATCHNSLDPQSFLEECVYDLCVVGGDRLSLCRGLSAYAQACMELGVSVGDWRLPANCPLSCPANSRYEACAPACPATCNSEAVPANCSARPCVEGCVCLSGFVARSGACVPASECGCIYEGQLLAPGQTIWADRQCRRRCTCDGATEKVRCSDTQGCPSGERCRVQNGLLGCHADKFGTCEASGDPHYVSFDGRRFDFMGTCTYLLAGSCDQNTTLPPFRVLVENEHRGSPTVSYTRAVRVEALGVEVAVRREDPGQVLVDGLLQYLPFQAADGQVQLFLQGSNAIIRTDFGLTVTYDWNSYATAQVPSSYAGALCGLCGNFNGEPGDDLALRGGGQAANALAFGKSWQEETRPGCGAPEPGECPTLDSLVAQQLQSKKECGILADPDGPFRECHDTLDPQGAVRDCVYDQCLLPGQSGPLCEALAAYATACQATGATVHPWRSEKLCPPSCPPHSHYEACSYGCPLSCGDLPVPGGCGLHCFESCVCDEGFVLSGESCVPVASCGCVHQGAYHLPGHTFYPGPGCETLCHCQEGGLVSCEPSSCGPHEVCKPSGGILGCVAGGSATCQASGDPHYTTFDGRRFDFMGTCVYVLAQTCGDRPGLDQFTVLQENVAWGNGKVSVTKAVTVQAANFTLRLEQSKSTVRVGDVDVKLPVELAEGRVWAFKHGSDVVIETDFGLHVAYDLQYYVRVTVPGNYQEQLCGLCGNYNGDPEDDFQKPNGSQASNPNDFGDSWEEPVPDSPCPPTCPSGNCTEVCAPELEKKYEQEQFCGLLASPTGPLAGCHKLVDPQDLLQDCVFDLCLGGGNSSILCSHIHAYVSSCQAAGGRVEPWRNETFCPLECPPHSHYEICADTCSLGCSALSAPSRCPDQCAEGCQCDSGFLSDGQACVPIQDCGCYHNGVYYDPAQTVLVDNCEQQCVCHAGDGVVCQNHSCKPQEVCKPVNGVLSCVPTEESCKGVVCGSGQVCQLVNGKPTCVEEPTAVCRAQGDPHYTTFDGHRYDMMGTCTYTMVELCSTDVNLPAFSVEAKNEHRGNLRVSYVGSVTVRAYSHVVSLARGEVGSAQIDHQRSLLPVSLSDGRLRVYQSGTQAVVELDFGLVVKYDWDCQLTVSLPTRFQDQVCGLCGNYNGDSRDDFLTPEREQAANAVEFAQSWKLDDGDYLCHDGCESDCPTCTPGQAQHYEGDRLCGMLALPDGPFANCHRRLDPQSFLEECVYDLCVVGGDRLSLCRGLSAYAQACVELGVSVGDWRSPANCPLACPANSRYQACAPACPATCNSEAAPANCSARPCVEGCVCLPGFVARGGACVPASECGCVYEGRPLAPGQAVWANDQCRRRCTCDGATQKVHCSDTQGCPAGELCRVQNGLLGCHADKFGTCEASGDPHYVSFDGRRFDFMGTCTYLLAGSCDQNTTLPPFRVLVENEHRGSPTVSYTRAVRVEALGVEVAVRREDPGQVLVDGILQYLPFQAADGQVQLFLQGSNAVIRTDFGLTVTYDWNSYATAQVPSSYAGALCGLCGNFNGEPGDDLALRGGGQAANALAFGKSWQEETRPGCGAPEPGECPTLDSLVAQQLQSKKECGILADPDGPFRECHDTLDPQGAVRDCVYDQCLLPGQSGPLCEALAAYATACQAAGATVHPWRSEKLCPPSCPPHSHYEACSYGCPLSCGDLPVPGGCGLHCFESCVCDEGFVLSGESCVPVASCGCVHQGAYHLPGHTFYPGPGCETLCHCQEGGLVSCEPSSCGPHEVCKPSGGILGCVAGGSATCQASGDPHYTTFDGRRFDFMGTCVYVLAQTCGDRPGLDQFTVLQENVAWGNGKVSVTKAVTVQAANFTLRLEQSKSTVRVGDVDVKLPVELAEGRVWAFKHGSDVVIETDFGLHVAYDLQYYVRVTVPGNYQEQLCGLCGNYNGDPEDDFQKPNGSQASNPNDFGDSWEEPVPDSPCPPTCPSGNCTEVCAPELEKKYEQEQFCGLLASPTGPLAGCHKLVDPQDLLQDCVFDLCLGGGNSSILCSHIHAYVSSCQAAGGRVEPWRNETFCPLECPPHSHYEICADTCSLGCSALSAPSRCPDQCAEGCQCDSGFLSDGQACVPIQDCGCYHNGVYYDPAQTVLVDNCEQQCVCHAGDGVVCQNHSCKPQEVCKPVNGVLSCVPTEESCKGVVCGSGQVCQLVNGKPTCVEEPTAVCRAQGDPHYTTFDGHRYDMMGTCTYTMVELCSTDVNLPAFSVEAKNEHRGNLRVSYVGSVTVRAYSHVVSLARGEVGSAQIDHQRSLLPVSLSDGRLRVYQSGTQAVVELDFGLVVKYDWDCQLTVSLPTRFQDQVCGLCGNYNGDSRDDFLTPEREQAANAVEFAQSWKLDDGDYLCHDGCESDCPTCTPGQAQHYEGDRLCGMLALPDGPFANCHRRLDPQSFLEECVYDLCVVGGDRLSLCRGLSAYAQACVELGVSVGDWRSPANCPLACPANSRYQACAPACPATCNSEAAPANCSARPCVEGCVCLPGFVARGGACVPASECGCVYEGRPLAPGQAVWANDQCRRRCTCDGATQKVHCSDTQGCPAGELCRVQNGLLGCHADKFGTCEASGDPHYVSFDGRRFDFMGTCTYLLAGSCDQNTTLPPFRVLVENEHRGSPTVSYTRAVRVEALGVEVAVRREDPGQVLVDGILQYLPFQAADGQVQLFLQGSNAVIRTDFGLTVTYDWNSYATAQVPSSYAGALCGLCGNFNGEPGDDLALRGGGQAANALAFGKSWQEETRPGCGAPEPGECPTLDSLVAQQLQSKKECGILADPDGPFRECHDTLDPQGAVRDCVYDQCLLPGQSGPLCEALAAYATACQAAGATVHPWRSEKLCPPSCPPHSHYEACSYGCPLSCGDLPVPGGCGLHCFESCVCDEGFVLSGESCVPVASCGCVHQGAYHLPGHTFYPGPGCETLCHCQEGGLVSCEPSSCGPHEVCKPSGGILGCVAGGSATCQASGDPHYTTFDGRRFDFMGTCVYVLAQTCGDRPGLDQFTVLQENVAWGNGKVSVTKAVTVQAANFTLRLEQSKSTVRVGDVDVKLPVELAEGRVWAFKHGSDVVIETDFGLHVAYDLQYYVRVTVPGNYQEQLCGLCGNYNGDPEDDFQKPNGSQASNPNDFGDSWEEPVPDSPCPPTCPSGNCTEVCAPELEKKYEQEQFCGLLASPTGPLAGCHKLVDPQDLLQDCVFDLCLGGGNSSILCSHIHAYVSSCQAAGGRVEPWRNETFCPLECPPHSHYEICADTCSLGCSALSAPSRCPDQCAEGCQCDSGFLSDGQACVPIQDCGCYHNGVYYDPAQTVLVDNCEQQCVCHAGDGVVCQNHSCKPQEVCKPVNGVLSCVPTEESCKGVVCGSGQVCQLVNGKPTCVEEPTAVCRAQGDPHYTTFDGHRYDMMGTCTYTMVELCSTDVNLPAFSVEAKNEHRGNLRVSYVGSVTVRAYSHVVSLARGEVGSAQIDHQRSLLPVSLSDGRLRVYQSGTQAVVELDFGLVVKYDWDCQLTVSLPTRFQDQVCGLCGNYNGDSRDDFLTPEREQAANAVEFAQSWKLDDGDYLCHDGCESDCPTCTPGQAQHYEGDRLCGMLALPDGPFANCHRRLDPQSFLEECVYDLCVVGGDRLSLCRGLSAYAQACVELGVSVGDWRSPANCPLACPANSRYQACAPACPATCNSEAAPANCSARPCVEGCVCLPGFVARGGACVPASECGCVYEGRPLAPGQAVWANDQCRRRCTCDGATQKVHCSDTQGCPAGELCRVQNGLLGCHADKFGTCEASGDPHYVSFDGRRFDFMGTCTYLLAGSCDQNTTLPPFRVLVENEHRGSPTVSYTRAVRVEALGVEVAVRREDPGQVLVDGILQYLPFQAADGQVQLFLQGSNAVIRTDFGLTVTYDWNSYATAQVPSSYAGALCGLCGNFNGEPGDDLALRGGGQAANALAFGKSWQEETRPGCGAPEPGECPTLDSLVAQQLQSKKECGILADPDGPFRECHDTLDPQGAVRDCVYDQCLLPGQSGPLCEALAAYATACQAAGATVHPWRSEKLCPPSCPPHSHYEACSYGCPLSCGDLPVPGGCGLHCFESCVCDEGFVLSGESCVPVASCGCVHQGAYHLPGHTFYPGPGCETLCHCQEGGLVSCEPSSCGPHEVCKPSGGILGCVAGGSATCQASGDPHYTTFDGRRFDFMGTCVYVLAQTCGDRPGLDQFTVLQENVAWGNGKVSVTKAVTVQAANFTLRLEQSKSTVRVGDVDVKLPVELAEGRVWAFKHGSDVVIETDFGLHVAYDLQYYVRVTVPGNYQEQLCGLCGNYNGDPEDDFQKPNGSQASNPNDFGDSWEEPVPDSPCPPTCPSGNCTEVCAPELEKKYEQEQFCGLLASPTGPLAGCHKLVDPQDLLQDCVFDLCLGGGNSSILCSHIHAYVSSCQAAGGRVEPWRNETFCPLECPPHSHYEICADTCSLGCSALSAPSRCPDQCAEGCQCDSGFLSDGQACVPIQDCGCYHNGVYYDPDQMVLVDNCQQQCVCHAGDGLVCQNHSCKPQEVCQPVNGVLSCITTDPCHSVMCRPQETCREQNGQGVCVPNYEVTCWLWGDPHYHSFDGWDFDFQGTCSYVLAKTDCPGINAEGLTPFTIVTKNENRGNPAVSYVRLVTVTTLGANISIHKGEIGKARVNGVLTALPVSVAGGQLAVTHGVSKAVLTANFGLQVTYDWDWRVEVTLPSSYHSAVCGLCGNMDGQPGNDQAFPNGTLAPSIPIWGGSWRDPVWDPLCWDECQGSCPTCPEDKLEEYRGPSFCGPLAPGIGGPFATCHGQVPPDTFFKGCILDVCLGGGAHDILCRALASYAAACQAAKITIGDWREQAGCGILCPDNSHYQLCGPPCPASCPSPAPPTTPDLCSGPCIEGCQCDEGFVLSVDHCVPLDGGCGCWANYTYYEAGSQFWADGTCSQRCHCGPGGGSLVCTPDSCGLGEDCALLPSGQYGCHPVSTAECQAWGDPHYVTLDGKRFDFQGTCEYLLSTPCLAPPSGAENFTVTVVNEHRGSQAVSYTRSVTLHIYNHSLTLSTQWPRQLQVDGKLVALPFQLDSRLHAHVSGADVVVTAANGLSLAFDGDSFVRLHVPAAYAGALCGLCGNYNQDPEDDLQAVGGDPARWQVGGAAGCEECAPGPCPSPCTPEEQAPFGGPDACGVIKATDGPLAPCHNLVPPEPYFQACLLDACQAQGHPSGLCPALATYVATCQAAGAQLNEWRRPDFCSLQCPAHSHYELCGNSCPVSCPSLSAPEGCEPICREGCVCDAGFLLSGDTCVPVGQCGCLHESRYYPLGEAFYPGPDCGRHCECGPGGLVTCQEGSACRPHEECRVENGVQACYPTGCGRCLSNEGIHYITLDGRAYDLHGSCSYVLAQVCDPQPEDENFSIVLEKDANGDPQRLLVTVDSHVVSLGRGQRVSVDGETMTLPVAVGPVRLTAEGRNVVLQTAKDLRLLLDDNFHILMSIPSPFRGRLCGLCGNFNGNWSDDFVLPSGSIAPSVEDFGAAWRVPNSSAGCSEGCGPSGCPVCHAEETAPYETVEACGQLQDTNGPFQTCHRALSPSEYFRQCVYDMCAQKGDSAVLCRSLAAYTAACQAAGVDVKPWRTDSFCPLQCPAHSHYSICTRTCQGSCAALLGLTGCTTRCFEGCECDDHFLLSNGICIPAQDCGCTHNGQYLPANSSLLTSDCSERCSCSSSSGLNCQAAGCPENRVCEVQSGIRDCWATPGLCSLSVDGNLTSFDGAHIPIHSPGFYDLSSICPGQQETSPWYRVVTDMWPCQGKAEHVGQAHIFFQDGIVTVTLHQGVWVNGRQVNLPANVLTSVSVSRTSDGSVLVQQKAGVQVWLRTNGHLTIKASNDHAGLLCGACGNFDGDQTDDWHHCQGTQMLESWRAQDFSPCHS